MGEKTKRLRNFNSTFASTAPESQLKPFFAQLSVWIWKGTSFTWSRVVDGVQNKKIVNGDCSGYESIATVLCLTLEKYKWHFNLKLSWIANVIHISISVTISLSSHLMGLCHSVSTSKPTNVSLCRYVVNVNRIFKCLHFWWIEMKYK